MLRGIRMSFISKAKKAFVNICPKSLIRPAAALFHKSKAIRCRADMFLFPGQMKVFCPCCGMKLRSFVAGSYTDYPTRMNPARYEHTRQDVLCPACKSLPRHRILASWFEGHKEMLKAARILYFAQDNSEAQWLKRNKVPYTTADLYRNADLTLDIQKTGLPDESYDVIICNHVLEHVDDFRTALNEMYRILRAGGSFICSFPMDPKIELLDEDPSVQTDEERLRRFGQHDHKRVFGMNADRFLTEAGFDVEKIDGADFPEEILPVVGPADYDMNILFRCVKPVAG